MENSVIELKRSPADWKFDISRFLVAFEPDEKTLENPQRTLELKTPDFYEIDPSWELVEETLRAVEKNRHHFRYHNFCILGFIAPPKDYIQTVYPCPDVEGQPSGWRLEWRKYHPDSKYSHYFAQMTSDFENSDTIPQFQTVIDAFHAFYYNKPWAEHLNWLVYSI